MNIDFAEASDFTLAMMHLRRYLAAADADVGAARLQISFDNAGDLHRFKAALKRAARATAPEPQHEFDVPSIYGIYVSLAGWGTPPNPFA